MANALPCRMPMQKVLGKWKVTESGWGLLHANTRETIDPFVLVTDEKVVMSDWEVHDMAVQIVCQYLVQAGKRVVQRQSELRVDPAIWFEDEDGPHFVVVRGARYPADLPPAPENAADIAKSCSHISKLGHFAPIVLANAEDPFDPLANSNGNWLPLWRGHPVMPKYKGLQPLLG